MALSVSQQSCLHQHCCNASAANMAAASKRSVIAHDVCCYAYLKRQNSASFPQVFVLLLISLHRRRKGAFDQCVIGVHVIPDGSQICYRTMQQVEFLL